MKLELRENDVIVSCPGNRGFVLYGPFLAVEAGIYRIVVDATVDNPSTESYFDVFSEERIYAFRLFRNGADFYLHVTRTNRLEFRFSPWGEQVTIRSVSLRPVLMDSTRVSKETAELLIAEMNRSDTEPNALFSVSARLVELEEVSCAEDLQQTFASSRPDENIRKTLVGLNSLQSSWNDETRSPTVYDRDDIARTLASVEYTVVDAHAITPSQKLFLSGLGYCFELMEATRLRRSSVESRRGWQLEAASSKLPFLSQLFYDVSNLNFGTQADLVDLGAMIAYCPISGRHLKSQHGFACHDGDIPVFIYRFEGEQVFYLCTACHSSTLYFMYLPLSNIIIMMAQPSQRGAWAQGILSRFKADLVLHAADVRRYLSQNTRPALIISNSNLGHFIWNDLGGIQHAILSGWLSKVNDLVVLPREYIDVTEVFPELADTRITRLADAKEAFHWCLQQGLLPLRATDAVVTEALAARMGAFAEFAGSADHAPVSDCPRPLVWINLRAHNKVWTDQIDGYAAIINGVYADYGSASVFVDGWSDCAEIAASIRAEVDPNVMFYDGLGFGLAESLRWASHIDAYVCTIGSGLVLLTWLAGRSGVTHAEREHMTQLNWWPDVRRSAPPPLSPAIESVNDVGGGFYCDYALDWRLISEGLRTVLDEKFERLPAVRSDF